MNLVQALPEKQNLPTTVLDRRHEKRYIGDATYNQQEQLALGQYRHQLIHAAKLQEKSEPCKFFGLQ
jgi:hypothetical protein